VINSQLKTLTAETNTIKKVNHLTALVLLI